MRTRRTQKTTFSTSLSGCLTFHTAQDSRGSEHVSGFSSIKQLIHRADALHRKQQSRSLAILDPPVDRRRESPILQRQNGSTRRSVRRSTEAACTPPATEALAPSRFLSFPSAPVTKTRRKTVSTLTKTTDLFGADQRTQARARVARRDLSVLLVLDFLERLHEVVEPRVRLVVIVTQQRHGAVQREEVQLVHL